MTEHPSSAPSSEAPLKTRCGFAAIIGVPNAGKSTLINTLVGEKISIVSSKVQTTRTRVLGIVVEEQSQIIFVDTPGLFKPSEKKRMERAIVAAAWEGFLDADIVVLVVDAADGITRKVSSLIQQIKTSEDANTDQKRSIILVLNKIDETPRQKLLALAKELNDLFPFCATFMVSAKKGDGVKDLMHYVGKAMPDGPWLYPEDQMTDMPLRLMAAEVTREKLFRSVHEEIPYDITVETDTWDDLPDGSIKITQTIFVAREGQKRIIIGKGGSMLGKIGTLARIEIQEITGRRTHLKVFVKVREGWHDEKERYTLWGLDPDA